MLSGPDHDVGEFNLNNPGAFIILHVSSPFEICGVYVYSYCIKAIAREYPVHSVVV
jgi:hypothetical protein